MLYSQDKGLDPDTNNSTNLHILVHARVSRVYFILQETEIPLWLQAIHKHIYIQYKYNFKSAHQQHSM